MSSQLRAVPERTQAERLHDLFAGNENDHGTYDPARLHLVGKKMEMKDESGNGALTVPGPPTVAMWERHLAGVRPLGVRPLRRDRLCRWGVIDIDDYAVSHLDLVAAAMDNRLPLVVCRSKSGGAHVFLFLRDWAPQAEFGSELKVIAAALGHPDVEAFPPPSGLGNWLNMPYFSGDEGERYAVRRDGTAMPIAEFLSVAEAVRIAPGELAKQLRALRSGPHRAKEASSGPHRAARNLARYAKDIEQATEGGRAKLLFGRAKDMGRMVGAGWIDEYTVSSALLQAANACGLKFSEATGHIRSGLEAGAKEEPDDDADSDRYPQIESIVIWTGGEDVLWDVSLAGHPVPLRLPVKEVMHYWTFNLRCAEKLQTSFRQMKNDDWSDRLCAALRQAEQRELPKDETIEGMFREALRDFLFDRHRGERIDDLLSGRRPAHIKDERRIYFKFADFQHFLERTEIGLLRGAKRHVVGRLLSSLGKDGTDLGKTTKKLMGRTVEVRWVRDDMFEPIDGPLPLPLLPPDPF